MDIVSICNHLDSIGDYEAADLAFERYAKKYNSPRGKMKSRWSTKYKKSIDCNNPKGFSQKNYCKRKRRGGKYKTEG